MIFIEGGNYPMLSDRELLKRWKELADDYSAVPGREKWDEYTSFIYFYEPYMIRMIERVLCDAKDAE